MYGQVITELENLMIIIVLERMRLILRNVIIHLMKTAFDGHNNTFASIFLIIIDII